jgi:hypothetical protein
MVGLDSAGDYPVEIAYGAHDDFLEALLMGSWTGDVLKNGVMRRSFTIEETRELGATDSFSRFTGAMVNRGEFTVNARAKAMCTFNLMARKEGLAEAIIAGATYAAANAEPMMSAVSVASLSIAGVASPKIRNLSFTVNNNLRTRPVVGDVYSEEFGVGRCDVTGSFDAYFASNALYEKVLAHGGGELSFKIGATANKKYGVLLPKLIFLDGNIPQGDNADDVMVTVPFRAVFDPTAACSIQITRAVA